jgi:iduronate 2-sulfatase
VEVAGLPAVPGLEGTSLVPLLEDPRGTVRTAAFSIAPRSPPELGHSIRTERWRYTEWPDGGRELYDLGPPGPWGRLLAAVGLSRGPGVPRNLASEPRYAGTIAEMQALLDR